MSKEQTQVRVIRQETYSKLLSKHSPFIVPLSMEGDANGWKFSSLASYRQWLVNPPAPYAPCTEEQADEWLEYLEFCNNKNKGKRP